MKHRVLVSFSLLEMLWGARKTNCAGSHFHLLAMFVGMPNNQICWLPCSFVGHVCGDTK